MSSNINFSAIDTTYPIAGQDNDSQGFRDNFTAISNALAVAKTEISTIQSDAILTSNSTNDLSGTILTNGLYNVFNGVASLQSSPTTDITLSNGALQVFTISSDSILRFIGWPTDSNVYAKVRVHIKSSSLTSYNVGFTSSNGGAMVFESTFPTATIGGVSQSGIALNTAGKHSVVEAWTYDHGQHVYVKYLGLF